MMLRNSVYFALWIFFILIFFLEDLQAQTRKPLQRRREKPPVGQWLGLSVGFNEINGLRWEYQLRDRNDQPSRSSLSLSGGLSLRYPEYRIINWSDSTLRTEHQWTKGIGIAALLNHYANTRLTGLYWSVGIGGHVFFLNPQNYKIFSVLAQGGYRRPLTGHFMLDLHCGGSVMGTVFRSSTGAEVNGFFIFAGLSASYQFR